MTGPKVDSDRLLRLMRQHRGTAPLSAADWARLYMVLFGGPVTGYDLRYPMEALAEKGLVVVSTDGRPPSSPRRLYTAVPTADSDEAQDTTERRDVDDHQHRGKVLPNERMRRLMSTSSEGLDAAGWARAYNAVYADEAPLSAKGAGMAIAKLVKDGLVQRVGERGRRSYRFSPVTATVAERASVAVGPASAVEPADRAPGDGSVLQKDPRWPLTAALLQDGLVDGHRLVAAQEWLHGLVGLLHGAPTPVQAFDDVTQAARRAVLTEARQAVVCCDPDLTEPVVHALAAVGLSCTAVSLPSLGAVPSEPRANVLLTGDVRWSLLSELGDAAWTEGTRPVPFPEHAGQAAQRRWCDAFAMRYAEAWCEVVTDEEKGLLKAYVDLHGRIPDAVREDVIAESGRAGLRADRRRQLAPAFSDAFVRAFLADASRTGS